MKLQNLLPRLFFRIVAHEMKYLLNHIDSQWERKGTMLILWIERFLKECILCTCLRLQRIFTQNELHFQYSFHSFRTYTEEFHIKNVINIFPISCIGLVLLLFIYLNIPTVDFFVMKNKNSFIWTKEHRNKFAFGKITKELRPMYWVSNLNKNIRSESIHTFGLDS